MKKFKFGLETVLSYKQQILDSLQIEHAEILTRLHRQEDLLESLWKSYREYGAEYRARCAEGLAITDVLSYQAGLRAREREIQQETERLKQLQKQEEAKRDEVIASKQDTSSIEKLKEKQFTAYQAAVAKSEELQIEEFVSMQHSVNARAASIAAALPGS